MTAREDISLILFVGPEAQNPEEAGGRRTQPEGMFREIYRLLPSGKKEAWTEQRAGGKILEYEESASGRIDALNLAAADCTGEWIFYLEPDEQCNWDELATLTLPSQKQTAYAAELVSIDKERHRKLNYQIRLFPNPKREGASLFRGSALPDLYPAYTKEGWQLDYLPFEIHKQKSIYEEAVDRLEAGDTEPVDPLSLLVRGIQEAESEQFKQAGTCFLKALESGGLFPFDQLAACNSLAEVLCEQGRWFEAKRYVQKSIDKCPEQRAPYLLMYKISSFKHEWAKACEWLDLYEEHTRQPTRANLDLHLPESELKLLKGETLFKLNKVEQAFEYYGQFYEERNGEINPVITERLLIYAIETENFGKATRYLGSLFNPYLPDRLNDVMEAKLHEAMALFMENGWHEYVFNLYERLYNAGKNKNLLLRWTATLVKAGQVDKARQLIAAEGNQFDVWAGKG